MSAPVIGLSLVGRQEIIHHLADLKKWGITSVRLPLHLPLRQEELQQLEVRAGCRLFYFGRPSMFAPGDSLWPKALGDAIDRLKASVTHWEIGTEPDDAAFGWPADHLATYAGCLDPGRRDHQRE